MTLDATYSAGPALEGTEYMIGISVPTLTVTTPRYFQRTAP